MKREGDPLVKPNDRRISIAPMMDWTDRHARFFLRLLSRQARLYTEMVTTGAILYGDRARFLDFDPSEHPLALQLGGSEPAAMAECARIGEQWGYDEININVGCPSDRVLAGRFGACLMAEPETVAACVAAMRQIVRIPVTVKTRIGIDQQDSYEELTRFIRIVAAAGCEIFIIHARKAWLKGLSPKENREIPPLRYEVVYQLKADFPQLRFILNGGLKTIAQTQAQLQQVEGVMIGREAYENPYFLARFDSEIFGEETEIPTRRDLIDRFMPYIEAQMARGVAMKNIARHLLGLYHGQPGARAWRRYLSETALRAGASPELIRMAAKQLDVRN